MEEFVREENITEEAKKAESAKEESAKAESTKEESAKAESAKAESTKTETVNEGDITEVPHKRRKRYKGTHPRRFEEKYKEHNPEKYKDTIEKVKSKGMTPAGMHISIMVNEIIDFLKIKPGQIGLDATLGYGGHTTAMLKCLEGNGHIYALDADPIEIKKTTKRLEDRGFGTDIVTTINTNFRNIDEVAKQYGPFDFILADLGVSSMQLDNPERGFSYKHDGPLDLRLNPEKGVSAAERIANISVEELEGMLIENSDEIYASEVATEIVKINRGKNKISTTMELTQAITNALRKVPEKDKKEEVKKCCARVFQALRIDVNSEFEVLYEFMDKLPDALAPGGRVAILTFHSGEDRLVKKAFKSGKKAGIYSEVAEDVIRPTAKECIDNPRAKSTKMRWAIKA